jgi:succinate dehydrogenase flavin-adding protein (antitoxin of CptAB toxin-antitoxin module)
MRSAISFREKRWRRRRAFARWPIPFMTLLIVRRAYKLYTYTIVSKNVAPCRYLYLYSGSWACSCEKMKIQNWNAFERKSAEVLGTLQTTQSVEIKLPNGTTEEQQQTLHIPELPCTKELTGSWKVGAMMFSIIRCVHRSAIARQTYFRPLLVSRRTYRGDAGDATTALSAKEDELLRIAQPKAHEIFQRHIKLPGDDLATRQKRLIYRSKQRGWSEVDLLLGTWASRNVPTLEVDELDQFEDFVNMETIDIYNIITLRIDVPDALKRDGAGIVERIQDWARSSPLGKADPDRYKDVKTEAKLI